MKLRCTLCWIALALGGICLGQSLPDAPSAAAAQSTNALAFAGVPTRGQQTAAMQERPRNAGLSNGEKFQVFVSHAESPLMFAGAGFDASVARTRDSSNWTWPRTYTAALAERESNAFFGRYLFPVLFDQDPRYHPAASEKFMPRAVYAASRVFVTRKDDGRRTLNTSYLLSTLLTSSLANVYKYPWDRTAANTFADVGSTIGGDAGFNLLREFWPQLREKLSTHTPKPLKKLKDKFSNDDEKSEVKSAKE